MMPKLFVRSALVAVVFLGCTTTPVFASSPAPLPTPEATWKAADWDAFSQNLVAALAGENEGLKLSALQMIVRHGEHLDVRDAEFEVVRLFRDHPDRQVRRLAAVACSELKSGWAMGFLRMSEDFEKDDRVRATIHSLVSENR